MMQRSAYHFTASGHRHRWLFLMLFLLILVAACRSRPALSDDAPVAPSPEPRLEGQQEEGVMLDRPFSYLQDGQLVQLAWFYKPPRQEENLERLATDYDAFILTRQDEPVRDALRQAGKGPFLQYIRFDAVHDPCGLADDPTGSSCDCDESPLNNNVAWHSDDICWIRDNHQEWFLRDLDGELVVNNQFVWMDPAQQGWREFWLQRARESLEEQGWDGVFLDNIEGSLIKHTRRGVEELAAYPDRQSYQQAIEGFLKYIYESYFQKENRPLLGNIVELRDELVWYRYLRYLDGAMEEAWAVGWSGNSFSRARWEEHMERAEQSQARDKHLILVAQGREDNARLQQFTFASYLLVANGRASFRYANNSEYDRLWNYQNYELVEQLGEPLGPRYQACTLAERDGECGIWRREFTRGSVMVDLSERRGYISVPAYWQAPVRLPGRIEAENYLPAPGLGYDDTSSGNNGGVYRADDVDIQHCSDGPNCRNVGWIREGEWLAYRVDIPSEGEYRFNLRVATSEGGKRLRLELDGEDLAGSLDVPETGGFDDWDDLESPPVRIDAGIHTLRVVAETDQVNINYIEVLQD